jgi:dCMP deaminase
MIHAEVNALSCISRYDNPYLIATTLLPCTACAINIAANGLKKVIYIEDYKRDLSALDIFKFYKIKVERYKV